MKKVSVALFFALLCACGGGGGDEDTKEVAVLAPTPTPTPILINENREGDCYFVQDSDGGSVNLGPVEDAATEEAAERVWNLGKDVVAQSCNGDVNINVTTTTTTNTTTLPPQQ